MTSERMTQLVSYVVSASHNTGFQCGRGADLMEENDRLSRELTALLDAIAELEQERDRLRAFATRLYMQARRNIHGTPDPLGYWTSKRGLSRNDIDLVTRSQEAHDGI